MSIDTNAFYDTEYEFDNPYEIGRYINSMWSITVQ